MGLDLARHFQMDVIDWLAITLLLGGPAAFATGRALARGWRSLWQLVAYVVLLAAFTGFLCWALFEVPVISASRLADALVQGDVRGFFSALAGYAFTAAILLGIGLWAFSATRARQMARQYPFLV
jgi:hypothetical protein